MVKHMNPEEQVEVTKIVIHSTDASSGDFIAVIALIVTILLAVAGWIFTIWRQQRNFKQEQQAKINYEIYSQLVTLHKNLQDAIGSFNAATSPPIIQMRADLVPYEIQQQYGVLHGQKPIREHEVMFKATQRYSNWVYEELLGKHSQYMDEYVKFLYLTEDWTAPLSTTQHALSVLRKEIESLGDQIKVHLDTLQFYSGNNGDDWRNWNEDDLRSHGQSITDLVMTVSMYIHDFMVIVHNELLAPYYNHERPTRKTMDEELKVLTKEGLVVRIEDDPEIRAANEEIIRRHAPNNNENI